MYKPKTTSCFAFGCKRRTPVDRFGCPKHWRMLPVDIKKEVWIAFHEGNRKRTLELVAEAAKYMRAKEGFDDPRQMELPV